MVGPETSIRFALRKLLPTPIPDFDAGVSAGPIFHELRGLRAPLSGYDVGLGYPPSLASKTAGVRIGRDSDKPRMSWSPLTRREALLSASAIR